MFVLFGLLMEFSSLEFGNLAVESGGLETSPAPRLAAVLAAPPAAFVSLGGGRCSGCWAITVILSQQLP